jgi:hypothetical protein
MQSQAELMPLGPLLGALAIGEEPIFQGEPLGSRPERFIGDDETRACLAGHGDEPILRHILRVGKAFFLRAVAELPSAHGCRTLPEATRVLLEKLEIAAYQLMDHVLLAGLVGSADLSPARLVLSAFGSA